jgi:hypothetical protein
MLKRNFSFFLIGIIVVFMIFFIYYFAVFQKSKLDISKSIFLERSPLENKAIYFVKVNEDRYSFVNIDTAEEKNFIPYGYEIVGMYPDPLPDFFIIQKNNEVYSLSLKDSSLKKIPITLSMDSIGSANPSISEKNKFYLEILRPIRYSEFAGYEYTRTKSYFYDAETNQIQSADNINLPEVCFKYDSKYFRFFIWQCTEGLGHTLPLSVYDLKNKTTKEIITLKDFADKNIDETLFFVSYNSGYFVIVPKYKDVFSKIIVVFPDQEITKQVFTIHSGIRESLEDVYPYSSLFAKDENTIVIGGGDFILLLRFNKSGEIIENRYFPEKEFYGGPIFYYNGKLYYQSKISKSIKVINLKTWQIEKTIPSTPGYGIALVRF